MENPKLDHRQPNLGQEKTSETTGQAACCTRHISRIGSRNIMRHINRINTPETSGNVNITGHKKTSEIRGQLNRFKRVMLAELTESTDSLRGGTWI